MVSADPVPSDVAPPPRPGAPRWRRWAVYWWWAGAAVGAGVAVRVRHWWTAGSLNSDELWIALNLRDRSYAHLRGPLDYDQLAPLGWLWMEKSLLAVGHDDRLLRAPSLVAGCATVVLAAVLAHRLLPGPLAVAAVLLCAGAPQLIYQSSQLKQYSVEAAAAVLLLLLAARAVADPGRRTVAAFWLTAAVAVWLATTAIFVALGVGGVLLLFALRDRDRSGLVGHALAGVPAVGSIAVVRALAPPPADWLYPWWSTKYPGSLAPPDPDLAAVLRWTAEAVNRFVYSALHVTPAAARVAAAALLALGAVGLARRAPRLAGLLCAPLACAYLLALLRLYPLASRVALWLVPAALLLICAGLEPVVRAARRVHPDVRRRARSVVGALAGVRPAGGAGPDRGRRVADGLRVVAAGALALAAVPWWGAVPRDTNADRYASAEAAVRYAAQHRRAGDRVRVHHAKATSALVAWYGPGVGLRPDGHYAVATGRRCRDPAARIDRDADGVWLLRLDWEPKRRTPRPPEHAAMHAVGRLVGERWFGRVVVLHYDIVRPSVTGSTAPSGAAAPTRQDRPPACLVGAAAE